MDKKQINETLQSCLFACNEFLKQKHLRVLSAVQIGKILRNEGFLVGQRKINGVSCVVILNLIVKNHSNHSKLPKSHIALYVESISNCNGSNGSNGSQRDLNLDFSKSGIKEAING